MAVVKVAFCQQIEQVLPEFLEPDPATFSRPNVRHLMSQER